MSEEQEQALLAKLRSSLPDSGDNADLFYMDGVFDTLDALFGEDVRKKFDARYSEEPEQAPWDPWYYCDQCELYHYHVFL